MTADASEFNAGSVVEFEGTVDLGLGSEGDRKESGDPNGIPCRVGEEKDGFRIERSVVVENGNLDDSRGKDLDLDGNINPAAVGDQETSEEKGENGELTAENGELTVENVADHDEGVDPVIKFAVTMADACKGTMDSTVAENGHSEVDKQKEETEIFVVKENDAKSRMCEEKGDMCKEEVKLELSFENVHPPTCLVDSSCVGVSEDKDLELDSVVEAEGKQEDVTIIKEIKLEKESVNSESIVAAIQDQANLESTVYDDENYESKNVAIDTDQQEVFKSYVVEGNGQEAQAVLNDIDHQLEERAIDRVDEKREIVIATTDAADQTDKDAPVVIEETKEPWSVSIAPNKHNPAELVLESQVTDTKDQGELDFTSEELVEEPHTVVTDFVDQAELTSAVEVEKEQKPEILVTEILPSESSVEQKEMSLSNESNYLPADEFLEENRTVPYVDITTSLQTVDDSESSESQKPSSTSDIDASVHKAEAGGILIEHSDDLLTEGSRGVPHVVENEVSVEVSRQVLLDVSDRSASCEEANHSVNSSAVDVSCPSDIQNKLYNDAENGSGVAETAVDGIDVSNAVKPEFRGEKETVESNTFLASSAEVEPLDMDDNKEAGVVKETGVIEEIQVPMKDSNGLILNCEKVDMPLGKPQASYIIRIPRFIDDQLSTKIQIAQSEVNEKTQKRDSLKIIIDKQKMTCNEFWKKFEAAKTEERTARAAVSAKRQQIDSVQLMINRLKNVHSIEELHDKIQSMEFELQHVTMSLKEEKRYIHELKQLRHQRDELTSNMGSRAEIDEVFGHKEQIDEQFKILKKELESLRIEVLRTEANATDARKKYDEEQQLLKGLQQQFKDADAVRQKAYGHWRELRNLLIEKNKHFNMYKNDQKSAENYLSSGDFEGLRLHCTKQVEKIMALWNNDEEFRMQYVKSNMNSTLRRLRTSDGRSLGPDEEPPVLQSNQGKGSGIPLPPAKITKTVPPVVSEAKVETPKEVDPFPALQAAPQNHPVKPKKSAKPISDETKETVVTRVTDREVEIYEKVTIETKEEEELIKKAEELSKKEEELKKEKAAAELREQCRLEQKAKAKEAEERKRRQAEKAQIKAEYRAQKEAELRERKRSKKQKKKVVAGEDASVSGAEEGPAPSTETSPSETTQELDVTAPTASKRPSRPAIAPKQYNKIQPIPLPLRKRGKRKMATWMWVFLTVVVVVLLFLAGNYISFSSFSFPQSGF